MLHILNAKPLKEVPGTTFVIPAKAGYPGSFLDSGQSLSSQALGGEHAGMTTCTNGRFIL